MNAIEKGERELIEKSWTDSYGTRHLRHDRAISILEQTAKAFAIEELEKVAEEVGSFGDPYFITSDIRDRIKSLKLRSDEVDEQELKEELK